MGVSRDSSRLHYRIGDGMGCHRVYKSTIYLAVVVNVASIFAWHEMLVNGFVRLGLECGYTSIRRKGLGTLCPCRSRMIAWDIHREIKF